MIKGQGDLLLAARQECSEYLRQVGTLREIYVYKLSKRALCVTRFVKFYLSICEICMLSIKSLFSAGHFGIFFAFCVRLHPLLSADHSNSRK